MVSQQWAPCGAIGAVQVPDTLGPGDSTWLSVTVQVLVACPAPIPVQFAVGYTYAGEAATVNLPGFPDLGQRALYRLPQRLGPGGGERGDEPVQFVVGVVVVHGGADQIGQAAVRQVELRVRGE